jgi:glycosyltransferase involved in cell wall biosynthesis
MRILFVDSGSEWRGGQYQVLNLAIELRSRDHEMLLVCQRGSALESRSREMSLSVETIRMRGDADVVAWSRLGGILRAFQPNVLHAHTGRAHAVALGATFFHDVDALLVTRRVVSPIRKAILNRLKYSRLVTAFVAISESVGETLVDAGVPTGRIRVIPSCVRLEDFATTEPAGDLLSELALSEAEPIVLNAAFLSKEKAQEDILSVARIVARQVPRVRFLIAGEGRLRQRLERRAAELRVGSTVRFLGFRQDVPRLMKASRVFIFPSESEGLGTSVLEAMAAGLPVVASRSGGTREIVKEGLTGFLVKPHDVTSMAEAVVKLLREPELASELGKKGRAVAQDFSFGRAGASHEELYGELAG